MSIDVRQSQTILENLLRDTVLLALGSRLPQQGSIAALRTVQTYGAGSTARDDDAIITVAGSPQVAFRWSQESTAADDGATVIQPNDVVANGRWLKWTSALRYSQVVGGNSVTLDQLTGSGPLQRVILIDKDMDADEVYALLAGAVPAVFIEAVDDKPDELTLDWGHRWDTAFEFTVSIVTENLRDRREAAQGSLVLGESVFGANTIDGFLKALLSDTQLSAVVEGIRGVRLGRGWNWRSELGQRRVVRSRSYTVIATEEFPNAPNELVAGTDALVQAHMTTPAAAALPDNLAAPQVDLNNLLNAGIVVPLGASLTQTISAGSAQVAGVTVVYAGQNFTFVPWTDTYRDLLANGTLVFVAVTAGAPQPAVTPTALRIGVTSTQASAVVSDRILCALVQSFGPRYDIPI